MFFSMKGRGRREEGPVEEERVEPRDSAAALALFVAEEAVNGLKRIGRTMPPSPMEIAQLEERLDDLLIDMKVPAEERSQLAEEFEKLRGRARLEEGRRSLIQSSRL